MDRSTIKNKLVTLLSAALLSVIAAQPAYAAISGEPLPFDAYTVANGEITAGCGNWTNANGDILNVTCTEPTISDGMLQREVTVSSADPAYDGTYVQFILVESGASGDAAAAAFSTDRGSLYFTSEDFIKMNNRGEGIATKQTILQSDFDNVTFVEDRFTMETTYKIGWAQANAGLINPWLEMNESVSQIQYDNTMALATSAFELYNEDVAVMSIGPGSNNTLVGIDQRLLMQDNKNAGDDAMQKFKHTRLSGIYNDTATDVHICIPSPGCTIVDTYLNANPLLPGGTNGGVVDWSAFDEIAATWIGVEAVNPGAASISHTFGKTKYENLSQTTGNILTELVSFTNPEAGGSLGAWDAIISINSGLPLFGHAEAMVDVATVSMTDFLVMNPAVMLGPLNLDYIANSDPTLPTATVGLTIADSDYNQWTVNGGVFTATCPSFADSCAAVSVNEGGFFQRWIVVNGEQYLQTIIVDDAGKAGALDPLAADYAANSLAFVNETFVKQGAGNGIASNMHLAERGTDTAYLLAPTTIDTPASAGDFSQDVQMNIGWANRGSIFVARDMNGDLVIDPGEGIIEPHAAIAVGQSLTVVDNIQTDAVSLTEAFTMERGATQADKRIGHSTKIGTQSGFADPIEFRSMTVTGAYQRTARADIPDPFILPGNSSDLAWAAGDALQATWLAGQYGTNPQVPVTLVESTSFTNLTSGVRIAYTETQTPPIAPDNWIIDPFLATPVYP